MSHIFDRIDRALDGPIFIALMFLFLIAAVVDHVRSQR